MNDPKIVETYEIKTTDVEYSRLDLNPKLVLSNVIPNMGSPNLCGESHQAFVDDLIRVEKVLGATDDDIENAKRELSKPIKGQFKFVYAMIDYPTKCCYRIRLKYKNDEQITYSFLLFLHSLLLRGISEEFDEDSDDECVMCHGLEELIYNGVSTIRIFDDYLTFNFDCDS